MSQILLAALMSLNSLLFTKMNHPMNMGILLLIQTLMTCLLTGALSYTTWFSYILFLVFLGGMLVLFIYMTSIASNEVFQKSNYVMMIFISTIIVLILGSAMLIDPMMTSFTNSPETLNMNNVSENSENLMLMTLYNMPNATITIFMVLYLFLTLIVIVFITKSHQGPLRPSN
uniref:NADH dehydrogenase subunit 6 n=1 Tax=Gomphus vulgatissimus TaxID=126241 RepID=UPI001EDFBA95|nr:NADH dehydrogenase subunit 6 [Gomphus vulgatissimus]UIB40224.1 NADH dehydrogenase subunit 6 [Gomphus vulgatissimus]